MPSSGARVHQLWQDLKFALRTLVKSPGFTVVAVLTLALGIGVNATVFALANGVLIKGFPFDRADRILYLNTKNPNNAEQFVAVSDPDFRDWRAQSKSFKGMTAWTGARASISDTAGLPETFQSVKMSANGFALIGQQPAVGRNFSLDEDAANAAPVAIISYGLWERRYGKENSIIGRVIRINGTPTTVIGVMPRDFAFPFTADLWIPLTPTTDSEKREIRNLVVFARMEDGATLKSARAEMETISRNLQSAYPTTDLGLEAWVRTFNEFYNGPFINTIFGAMLGAVSFVLLIACANVANLLLGRAVGRMREISIRMALGAGRWRIIRQLLVESLLLSTAGGLIGWLIAIWGVHAFDAAVIPYGKPAWMNFSMDYRVFTYLVVISVGTGILFGLAPALRLANVDVNSSLKDGGRGASTGARTRHLSGILVIAEVALAVVLLAGAGLMVRTFLNVYQASLGVNTSNVLTMRLALPAGKYPKPTDMVSFHERLKTRLQSLPGVTSVEITNFLPTGGSTPFEYEIEGVPPVASQRRPTLSALVIGPDYFRTMDVRPLSGRAFTDIDGVSGPPVVIVNQNFAGKFWPGQDPLGKRLRLVTADAPEQWLQVVGVVPNIVQNDISPRQIDPLIYMPYRQKPMPDMAIVARTVVPPGTLAPAFRREIQALDSDLPIYNLWTMQERLARNYWFYQVLGILFVIFAGVALFLASVGLYAVMAHSVSQRTQEIGVRMAMGATTRTILRLLFTQGMLRVAMGLAIGLVGAFGVTRILKTILIQVAPADPLTFATASVVLAIASTVGCWIPARRAMRVDPMVALRHE
jgi:putative ABC transport system permease protein